ncbi:MAG: lytic transglycosylase domain-containing protein [Rhizobium sp.]|nr:lytic transglycosylase domain-containing protein [Rhizobium sp.]
MRICIAAAIKALTPLFAERPSQPLVPFGGKPAGAHSELKRRPTAGACTLLLTTANPRTGSRRGRDRALCRPAVFLLAGMLSFGGGSAVVMAEPAQIARPVAADLYAADIAEASQRFGIPELWIRAVLRAESAGDKRAVSSAGAMGLMQVMPDTWVGLRLRHRLGRDPYDVHDNILAGAAYLREMFDRYGNVAAMLASYNAGPDRYDEYLATGRVLPPETRAYVAALVPVLDGRAASVAPPRPSDWREAPLFVTRPADVRIAAAPPSGAQSDDARATVPVRNYSALEPDPGSMFVAHSSDGATP